MRRVTGASYAPAQADTSGEFPIFMPPRSLVEDNAFGQRQVAISTESDARSLSAINCSRVQLFKSNLRCPILDDLQGCGLSHLNLFFRVESVGCIESMHLAQIKIPTLQEWKDGVPNLKTVVKPPATCPISYYLGQNLQ